MGDRLSINNLIDTRSDYMQDQGVVEEVLQFTKQHFDFIYDASCRKRFSQEVAIGKAAGFFRVTEMLVKFANEEPLRHKTVLKNYIHGFYSN